MGQNLPTEWPVLDTTKWYCVVIDAYRGVGCDVGYEARYQCCFTGTELNFVIDNDWECNGVEICGAFDADYQRIINIFGPYDSVTACDTACV